MNLGLMFGGWLTIAITLLASARGTNRSHS